MCPIVIKGRNSESKTVDKDDFFVVMQNKSSNYSIVMVETHKIATRAVYQNDTLLLL